VIAAVESALLERTVGPLARDPDPLGDVHSGSRVRVQALRGSFRDFHAWLVRE
jgi:hypothetical protein